MSALEKYISVSRLIVKAVPEVKSTWSNLTSLLPSLRLALTCSACGNVLSEPYSSEQCKHNACRTCVESSRIFTSMNCSCSKNNSLYSENKQLEIVLKCYKELCVYIKNSPLYNKIVENVDENSTSCLIGLIDECQNKELKFSAVYPVNDEDAGNLPVENGSLDSAANCVLPTKVESQDNFDAYMDYKSNNSCMNSPDQSDKFKDISETLISDALISENCITVLSAIRKENDHFILDDAPVLSPVQDQVENVSSSEIAPTLSPVHVNESNLGSFDFNSEDVKLVNTKIESELMSNYEAETNSETSSMSSVSSPLQISPSLQSQASPDNVIQEQLDGFSLATSLTTASVLELEPSNDDLMRAADVLHSLGDDDASYPDLPDLNLSTCNLSSINEDAIKDEITSISEPVLSLPTSITPSQISIACSSNDSFGFGEISPTKFELPNIVSSNNVCISNTNTCNKLEFTVGAAKLIVPQPNTIATTQPFSQAINVASTQFVPSISLPSVDKMQLSNTANTNALSVPVVSTSNLLNTSFSIQSNFTPAVQTHFIRNSSVVNSARMITPNVLSNIRTAVLSPTSIQVPMSPTTGSLCSPLTPPIVQSPLTSHGIVQANAISGQLIQPAVTCHQILPSNTPLVIPKTIASESTVAPCHLGTASGVLINSAVGVPKMFISTVTTPVTTSTTPFAAQPKFNTGNHVISSNMSFPSVSTTTPQSFSSGFLNILPAGTIFPSSIDKKVNNSSCETQIKSAAHINNGSSIYSVRFSDNDSTKMTIKRAASDSKPLSLTNSTVIKPPPPIPIKQEPGTTISVTAGLSVNHNHLKKPLKPKAKPKPKPKKKGCRCGNATPSPGKLTCCGQRCPCYVDAKACIECRCKGCRNPHRPGGKKVRPIIPHQANIHIHQIQPVHSRVLTSVSKTATASLVSMPVSVQQPFAQFTPQNTASSSLLSANSTVRAFQTIHSGPNSVNQIMNVKECLINNSVTPDAVASNILSLKPIKIHSVNSQFFSSANLVCPMETVNSDVDS